MRSSAYSIQTGEKLQHSTQIVETSQQENISKLEGLQDSLETTKADLIQAVRTELSNYKNPVAIEQAFNMVTHESVAGNMPSAVSAKTSETPLHLSRCLHRSRGLVHAVEWRSSKYRFPIGTLQVEHVEGVDVEMDAEEATSVQLVSYRSKKFRFIFEPPHWFSSLVLKVDIAMQIAAHGCSPSISWGQIPRGSHLEPLVDELHQLSHLTLDRRLLAIARIGELDHLFEV